MTCRNNVGLQMLVEGNQEWEGRKLKVVMNFSGFDCTCVHDFNLDSLALKSHITSVTRSLKPQCVHVEVRY